MISKHDLRKQLKKLKINPDGWGRTEYWELINILRPDEEICEAVNGYYEAGFALLVATENRVLLVDKKPLNYLTVEDWRFDMINEFDYSHRLFGAHVSVSSGLKTLSFTSLNQPRLRNLVTYVQNRMTEVKKISHEQQENQRHHLEKMNEQLEMYLETAREQAELNMQQTRSTEKIAESFARQNEAPIALPAPASTTSFEKAAAVSMGLTEPVYYEVSQAPLSPSAEPESSESTLHKIILTPQQVGLAAARRVVPIISAYGRVPMVRQRQRFAGHSQTSSAETASA